MTYWLCRRLCDEQGLYYFTYEWPWQHERNPFVGPHLEVFTGIVAVDCIQVIAATWFTVLNHEVSASCIMPLLFSLFLLLLGLLTVRL